ncbi:MAG: CDP-diacylglycerol--glycerol-3-phosphate 3-phosphatidyltransferase [Clostridia bacterium]
MNKKNLPNTLCYIRMAAVPFIMFILLYTDYICRIFPFKQLSETAFGDMLYNFFDSANSFSIVIAGIIFILAMITDALDGHFARKYGVVSEKGKSLDPLADKILIIGTILAFYFLDYNPDVQKIMLIPVLVIIIREVVVTMLRSYCAKRYEVVGAMIWGKIKTVTQTLALIIYFVFEFVHFPLVGQAAIIVASVVTALSAIPYFIKFFQIINKQRKSKVK